jgi:pimeloyl-ACP methyl ester carboxylesterase
MFFFASHGYRCIAADRRGHGRSSQPWTGNDMDTYSDDLAALVDKLDVKGAVFIGHSTGGGEVVRYLGRHGTSRAVGAILVSDISPLMLKTPPIRKGRRSKCSTASGPALPATARSISKISAGRSTVRTAPAPTSRKACAISS